MKHIGMILSAFVFGMSVFGSAACSGAGGGCGGETEESLEEQTRSSTQKITTTCGGGTHLVGNTCVRNTPVQTQSQTQTQTQTTLGN